QSVGCLASAFGPAQLLDQCPPVGVLRVAVRLEAVSLGQQQRLVTAVAFDHAFGRQEGADLEVLLLTGGSATPAHNYPHPAHQLGSRHLVNKIATTAIGAADRRAVLPLSLMASEILRP